MPARTERGREGEREGGREEVREGGREGGREGREGREGKKEREGRRKKERGKTGWRPEAHVDREQPCPSSPLCVGLPRT